jgi:predicted dehydrogenase
MGISGAGNHIQEMLLPPLQAMSGVSLPSICTAASISANTLAGKIHTACCPSDARSILENPTIHSVLIDTRHDSHASLVVKSLLADTLAFVEKPSA